MFRTITIKQKVYFLAVLGAVLAILISTGSVLSIVAVGTKLKQIAEEDIPLTNNVTEITVHQLEQAIYFERASRYAEIMGHDDHAGDKYEESKAKFWKYAKTVDAEILEAENMATYIIEQEAGNPEIVAEFTDVLEKLKAIEKEHKYFDDQVEVVFSLFEAGKLKEAETKAEAVSEIEDHLDKALADLLKQLEHFTAEAALAAEKLEKKVEKILIITSLIGTIIFLIIATFIVRGIVRPLLATKDYADELSVGNLDVEAPTHSFEDEIADMMKSLSVFKENAIQAATLKKQSEEQERLAEAEKKKMMMELADDFDTQVGNSIQSLASSASNLTSTAETMKDVANNTSDFSRTVAESSNEASVNVSTVASAMEEMSATSSEISLQINRVKDMSDKATGSANNANDKVQNLNQLAQNIGEVVISIQDIAEQTNLLALNATIESARAGEAGKGFAVVADEVKKLATETSKKTEEINERITEIQGATSDSVSAMEEIISSIQEIDSSVTGVSAAVEEQNATTSEIVRSVSEASQGTQQVSSVIMEVQQGAQKSEESAESVLKAAQDMSSLSDGLKDAVASLLMQIRSDNK